MYVQEQIFQSARQQNLVLQPPKCFWPSAVDALRQLVTDSVWPLFWQVVFWEDHPA